MKIYHYNPETGEFIVSGEPDPSPREPGKYLIPAFATEVKPPKTNANQVAVFEGIWKILPDYRNTPLFSTETGEQVLITTIGPCPDGLTEIQRTDADHVWDGKSWIFDRSKYIERLRAEAKAKITSLMQQNIESMNIVRWSAMTEEQQQAWISYRQALLDVPKQPGFPETVEWPEAPAEGEQQ